jgi:glucans biosynthesis protein
MGASLQYRIEVLASGDDDLNIQVEGPVNTSLRGTGFRIVREDNGEQVFSVDPDGLIRGGNEEGAGAHAFAIYSPEGKSVAKGRFTSFEVVLPVDEANPILVKAPFSDREFTGQFTLSVATAHRERTVADVSIELTFLTPAGPVAIGHISGSFLFGAGNRYAFDDYRPTVHSVEGLAISNAAGPPIWRSLNNPPLIGNSYFSQENPRSFALIQRERTFDAYQDADRHYELSPSLTVEPLEKWGRGFVRLIEVPARSESESNIAAFWMPERSWEAGDSAVFRYRLTWNGADDTENSVARVVGLSAGRGGVSGVHNDDAIRKFVVDFEGDVLKPELLPPGQIDAFVSVSPGQVEHVAVSRLPGEGRFRLAIDATIHTTDPVELRAYLIGSGRQLTETWLYQWRAPTG